MGIQIASTVTFLYYDTGNNSKKCHNINLTCTKIRGSSTVKSLLQAQASIRIITIQRDGSGPLLEATSVRKESVGQKPTRTKAH